MGAPRFGINLPGIHPFEIIATVADAIAGPQNCHLSSRAIKDRNPKLPGRALLYQNRGVHLAVAIKISVQVGRFDPKGEIMLFSGWPVR